MNFQLIEVSIHMNILTYDNIYISPFLVYHTYIHMSSDMYKYFTIGTKYEHLFIIEKILCIRRKPFCIPRRVEGCFCIQYTYEHIYICTYINITTAINCYLLLSIVNTLTYVHINIHSYITPTPTHTPTLKLSKTIYIYFFKTLDNLLT